MIKEFLTAKCGIKKEIVDYVQSCEKSLQTDFERIDEIKEYNQYKIVSALRRNRISDSHFSWTTGYGYDDPGRQAVEKVMYLYRLLPVFLNDGNRRLFVYLT